MSFIKYIFGYLMKTILYATAFGLIGTIFSLVRGWPLLRGAYIFVGSCRM